jgi:xylulokinase
VLGTPVLAPPPGEYVAIGAARQAAWVLSGDAEPPVWSVGRFESTVYEADPTPQVRTRYAEVRELTAPRLAAAPID